MCMFIFTFHFLPLASSERALLFTVKQYLLPSVNIWDPMALNTSFKMSIIAGLYSEHSEHYSHLRFHTGISVHNFSLAL